MLAEETIGAVGEKPLLMGILGRVGSSESTSVRWDPGTGGCESCSAYHDSRRDDVVMATGWGPGDNVDGVSSGTCCWGCR